MKKYLIIFICAILFCSFINADFSKSKNNIIKNDIKYSINSLNNNPEKNFTCFQSSQKPYPYCLKDGFYVSIMYFEDHTVGMRSQYNSNSGYQIYFINNGKKDIKAFILHIGYFNLVGEYSNEPMMSYELMYQNPILIGKEFTGWVHAKEIVYHELNPDAIIKVSFVEILYADGTRYKAK